MAASRGLDGSSPGEAGGVRPDGLGPLSANLPRVTRFKEQRLEARLFAIGSSLFAIGAVLASIPEVADPIPGVTFFTGSLFFTTAALIQWLLSGRPRFAGWSGADASDWWSAAIQFIGTLFFNVSTFAAILDLPLLGEVRHVWRPDVYGSAAFLVSSLLAVIACTDRDRLWDPAARSWKVAWLNMFGSVAFGVSAVAARIPLESGTVANPVLDNLGTFLGALGFLGAALLTAPRK